MKNKEIEEILNDIKKQIIIDEKIGKEIAQDFHKTTLNYKETKLLLLYIEQLENNRDKAIEILGNYKHYSTPTEEQNRENEEIVDNAYNILKGDRNE